MNMITCMKLLYYLYLNAGVTFSGFLTRPDLVSLNSRSVTLEFSLTFVSTSSTCNGPDCCFSAFLLGQ